MTERDPPRFAGPDPKAPVPSHLYKYRSLVEPAYVRDLVVNQRLYFPGAGDLNDPFECKPYLTTLSTPEQRIRYVRGFLARTMAEKPRKERLVMEKQIRGDMRRFVETMKFAHGRAMAETGIYSLSQRHLDLLMWPHYANNHHGICVRFRMDGLLKEDQPPLPVTYASHRPVSDPVIEEPEDMLHKAVLTKGMPWSYEKEWRLVINRGARQVVQLRQPVIDGVILGARIIEGDRDMVLDWAREAGRPIEVFAASFHEQDYALVEDQIM